MYLCLIYKSTPTHGERQKKNAQALNAGLLFGMMMPNGQSFEYVCVLCETKKKRQFSISGEKMHVMVFNPKRTRKNDLIFFGFGAVPALKQSASNTDTDTVIQSNQQWYFRVETKSKIVNGIKQNKIRSASQRN